jgi:hypothetical protein
MCKCSNKIRQEIFGVENLDTLRSRTNLASTYSNQGRRGEAEQLEVQVMVFRRRCSERSISTR